MWGMQAERTVSVPSKSMSESASELPMFTILLRKSGSVSATSEVKDGSSISCSISAVSAISAISAVEWFADLVFISAVLWGADFADSADIADLELVEMEIPASLAFWKKVLMVTPVP